MTPDQMKPRRPSLTQRVVGLHKTMADTHARVAKVLRDKLVPQPQKARP